MGRAPLTVDCPSCRQRSVYGPDNPWRPFCSERCRNVDLGAWATESYRMPTESASDDGAGPPEDPPRH